MWLHKQIEEKGDEVRKVYPWGQSFLVSISSRMLIWLCRPIHLLNVHFSRFDMLTPIRGVRTCPQCCDSLEYHLYTRCLRSPSGNGQRSAGSRCCPIISLTLAAYQFLWEVSFWFVRHARCWSASGIAYTWSIWRRTVNADLLVQMSVWISASYVIFYCFCLNHFSVPLRHRPQLREIQ